MCRRPVYAAALVVLVACADAPAGPYTPSALPPSGLNVSLAEGRLDPAGPIPTPTTITAAGDSVVVIATLSNNCVRWSPRAGVAGGTLVVTVVDSMPRQGRTCQAIASLGLFRAVVRPAPPGRYPVAFRSRTIAPDLRASEVEHGRARVTVR